MMRKIWIVLLLALILTGCKVRQEIKLDTIVDIPLHPTEETAQETTPTETEAPTEETIPTEAPTEKPQGSSSTGQTSSGGKKSSKGSGSKKETDPPETEPVTTPPTERPTEAPTEPPTQAPTEAPTQPQAYDPSGYAPNSLDRGVADAVNAYRQEAGLPPLTLDTRLCAIASVRAREASRVWSQNRPDGSAGITVLNEYGYGYSCAAQNLYFGTGSAASIVDKWMSADVRKANILMESATTIGVGNYTAEDGLTYVAALIVG